MSKFSLLMPFLTGISALALIVNSPFFAEEKRKSATGVVLKVGRDGLVLQQSANKQVSFEVTAETQCHLNERQLAPAEIQEGRKATVIFDKVKGKLVARAVDVFPVPEDVA